MDVLGQLALILAKFRFKSRGAKLTIGSGTQLRSFYLHPCKSSTFEIGEHSIFSGYLSMDRDEAKVKLGSRTFFGKSHIVAAKEVSIGDDVLVSWGVTIVDHHSHSLNFEERKEDVNGWLSGMKDWTHVKIASVTICDKVWIGFGATILPGITVGEGAIIGAQSVVTKDVEPWTVVAGNPARFIRKLTIDKT